MALTSMPDGERLAEQSYLRDQRVRWDDVEWRTWQAQGSASAVRSHFGSANGAEDCGASNLHGARDSRRKVAGVEAVLEVLSDEGSRSRLRQPGRDTLRPTATVRKAGDGGRMFEPELPEGVQDKQRP